MSDKRPCPCPGCYRHKSCWYKRAKWQSPVKGVRRLVLLRDGNRCWVGGCTKYADIADHIEPVHPEMSEAQFYGMHNLRASCRFHNVGRGWVDRMERDTAGVTVTQPRRTVFDRPRFLSGTKPQDRPLPKSTHTSRYATITADYSRKPVGE